MKKFCSRCISLFALCVFILALTVLHRQMRHHSLTEIFQAMSVLPWSHLLMALGYTVLGYLLLTGYDFLALRFIKHPLPYSKTIVTSFIGHAISINVGLSPLTGGSIRYRLYSQKGLSGMEILHIVGFSLLTFWLGFLALAGVVFFFAPGMQWSAALPSPSLRTLGAMFLVLIGLYMIWTIVRRKPLSFRSITFPRPSLRMTCLQILVASSEWIIGAAVLHALLPVGAQLPYVYILGLFLVAQISGLASQVPGGIGVFESVILALIPGNVDVSGVLGALLLYRFIYNLLPLSVATCLLAVRELHRRRHHLRKLTQALME